MPKSNGKRKKKSKEANGTSLGALSPEEETWKKRCGPDETFVDKLLKKADELRDKFEYDLAAQFYKRTLECQPDHMLAIESLAHAYLQLGELEQAHKYLLQGVQLSPEKGFGKYFALGQLNQGQEALNYFKKGIEVLELDLNSPNSLNVSPLEGSEEGRKRDLSMAYCAMAEVYMTDLCDEEDAEAQCKAYLDSAISADEANPEAHMCLASFHLVKEELEDAQRYAEKSLSVWFPDYKLSREQKTESCPLSYDARINTSKVLIELSMFDEAADILDGLVEEDDEVVQVWYMLGLLNHLRGQDYYGNARFYFHKGLKVCKKLDLESENEEQVCHMKEMLDEMGPGSGDEDDTKEDVENDSGDDDEYETLSEEEMDS